MLFVEHSEGGSQGRPSKSSIAVGDRLRSSLDPLGDIKGTVAPGRQDSILVPVSGFAGGTDRSNRGRTTSKRSTLIAPERLNIETPKKVAAEGTSLSLYSVQRATERGRTTSEYESG